MNWLCDALTAAPVATLFLAVALGHGIGHIAWARYRLGPVAGTLLVAGVLGQAGVQIDAGVKALSFTLFIYTVGYLSGPHFFATLTHHRRKEVTMALFLATVATITVVLLAWSFDLDAGTAAGLAAGGLAQSTILSTAADAFTPQGATIDALNANMAAAYAVSYLGGTLGVIIFCADAVPWLMRRPFTANDAGHTAPKQSVTTDTRTHAGFLTFGMAAGLLLGLVRFSLGSWTCRLGSVGPLLSGLALGWWHSRSSKVGAYAPAAAALCRDLGLTAFVGAVGLNAAPQAWHVLQQHGPRLFVLGWVITIVPLALTFIFSRYVLSYHQVDLLAGALAGARSSNPALGAVLAKTGHDGPVSGFIVAYTIANLALSLLGPVVVHFCAHTPHAFVGALARH